MFSFSGNCQPSKAAVPFCIPTSNKRKFLLLHILSSFCCFQYSRLQWYLIVSICSSLMTRDPECLFICSFLTCVFALVKCLSRSLAHFLTGLFVFLLLSLRVFYIFRKTIRYQMYICKYFLFPNLCLFILLTMTYPQQKYLILMKSSLPIIFLTHYSFEFISKKSSPYPRSPRFPP